MKIIDFYKDLKAQYELHEVFFDDDDKGSISGMQIEALSFFIVNMTRNTIGYVMDFLEEDSFCYRCIYQKMDRNRRAISRYLIIEKEHIGKYGIILEDTREKLNEWCKFISSKYDMNIPEEHPHIDNPDYDLIQLEKEPDDNYES